ncbi:hypothetical protein ABIE67_004922 [Streptomyces sp. V4I8]
MADAPPGGAGGRAARYSVEVSPREVDLYVGDAVRVNVVGEMPVEVEERATHPLSRMRGPPGGAAYAGAAPSSAPYGWSGSAVVTSKPPSGR